VKRRSILMSCAGLLLPARSALAQAGFPNKAIRYIVPVAAVGGSDLVGRTVTERWGKALNQRHPYRRKRQDGRQDHPGRRLDGRRTPTARRHLSAPRAGLRPARPPRGSSKVAEPHLLESAPRAGLRPARPPRGSSKVAEPHLLESAPRAGAAGSLLGACASQGAASGDTTSTAPRQHGYRTNPVSVQPSLMRTRSGPPECVAVAVPRAVFRWAKHRSRDAPAPPLPPHPGSPGFLVSR
jgi:hypothetical protein